MQRLRPLLWLPRPRWPLLYSCPLGHMSAHYLTQDIQPSAADDPECDRTAESGSESDVENTVNDFDMSQLLLNYSTVDSRLADHN